MKSVLLLFFLVHNTLSATTKFDMLKLYQEKNYVNACHLGRDNYIHYTKDEEFITLYAFSCLYADYIDRLAVPISALKYTKEARANAAYFATVLMQKKLLYHALVDQYNIYGLSMPATSYILSKVFNLYTQTANLTSSNGVYSFVDTDNQHITYKLFIEKHTDIDKMVIEVFRDTILQERHVYW